jgi:hypothetical protein
MEKRGMEKADIRLLKVFAQQALVIGKLIAKICQQIGRPTNGADSRVAVLGYRLPTGRHNKG